ncbi:MAG: RNA polymerase factor sigma-54, partial [Eubacteriales bacterium]|nr:RNA polymerase factor sigma-54 [Eubacteriales bacterium]
MCQSLKCLQLTAQELGEYIMELALSNPVLEVQPADYFELLPLDSIPSAAVDDRLFSHTASKDADLDGTDGAMLESRLTRQATFSDYLREQTGQIPYMDREMRALCGYIIGCLDRRGYLDCPLEELAEETGNPMYKMEQALYAVQMLDPPGVGARNLSECLILQLAQGEAFARLTLAIARDGLELLSRRDYVALARKMDAPLREVKRAADAIMALNPIPSRGYPTNEEPEYVAPDALITTQNGRLAAEVNERVLPRISISTEYLAIAEQSDSDEVKQYIRKKVAEANSLIADIRMRSKTLYDLMVYLIHAQCDFFLGGDVVPITMKQAADALGVSVSTVSRAVQNKYVQYDGRIFAIRDFFTAPVRVGDERTASPQMIRRRILFIIGREDKSAPLTDEQIRLLLEKEGISIGRRTVAKYRSS